MYSIRKQPNILVTGTPGVGKTTFCGLVAEECNKKRGGEGRDKDGRSSGDMEHVEVAKLIKEEKLYREWDEELDCSIFDDELVVDRLEKIIQEGNKIVDFHSVDFFPEGWFDLVVVLRTDTHLLYERLEKRNYSEKKIQKNVECEIFQVLLDEAVCTFEEEIVKELANNTVEELDENVAFVCQWVNQWKSSSSS